MIHLASKLTIYPAILFLSSLFLPGIHFTNISQILMIGWILSIIAYAMDIALLARYGNPVQTGTDFVFNTVMLIIFQYMLPTANITFGSIIIIAIFLSTVEYVTHAKLLRAHRGYYVLRRH